MSCIIYFIIIVNWLLRTAVSDKWYFSLLVILLWAFLFGLAQRAVRTRYSIMENELRQVVTWRMNSDSVCQEERLQQFQITNGHNISTPPTTIPYTAVPSKPASKKQMIMDSIANYAGSGGSGEKSRGSWHNASSSVQGDQYNATDGDTGTESEKIIDTE